MQILIYKNFKSNFDEINEDRGVQDIKYKWGYSLFIYSLTQQSFYNSHFVPHSDIGTGNATVKKEKKAKFPFNEFIF